jgi:Transposase DDE domain
MYIESVPNRNSPPAILLRESYRDGAKIKKRTIANLSDWPGELVEGLRTLLKGGTATPADQQSIIVRRALPHGHVAAVLGTLRDIGLDRVLGPAGNRPRDLVIAMIVARLIAPASKLATARMLDPATAASSLGDVLGLGPVDEDELYAAIDWLGERQQAIEKALARKHLRDGTLVLYDVSSSYLEGRCCELAKLGYSRDGKKGKLQIVYGLLCAPDGCPVAIEVFEGNTADPRTLGAQIDKIKSRFALKHVVLVGDRGMITQARLDAEIAPAGLDWITALRAPAIRALAEGGALQMSLFDERDMAAITSPDYPGERLIVCRNPISPVNAPASASTCWRRRNAISPPSRPPPPAPVSRCAGRPRLPSRSAPSSTGTRWPSTSSSTSVRRALRSIATPTPSRPRPLSTASMWCAPTWPNGFSTMPRRSAPTNRSQRSSGRSVH